MGRGTVQTTDDNRVELNWNDGRLNVNNNWDDNRNDNVFMSSLRHFLLLFSMTVEGGGILLESFVAFIQPPSIRPISSTICCICTYFFRLTTLVSRARRSRRRSTFSSALAASNASFLLFFSCCPARNKCSMNESDVFSMRCHSAWRSCFGTVLRSPCNALYKS